MPLFMFAGLRAVVALRERTPVMLDARKAALVRRQIKDARELGEKVMLGPDVVAELLDAWCDREDQR